MGRHRSCLGRLRERGALPDGLAAISVTSQWSGTVAIDEEGEPLANAIIWMDSRGADDIRRSSAVRCGSRVRPAQAPALDPTHGRVPSLSGKDPIGPHPLAAHRRPELDARTWMYLEPKDWLNLKLTGRCVATYDSIVMHWVTDNRDPANVRYDDTLLGLAGLRREWLPDLVPATDVIGPAGPTAAEELGLPAGTPVIGGTPDVQSAAVGSGAVADYEGHLYLGTSSWLSCHVPFKKTDVLRGVASLPARCPVATSWPTSRRPRARASTGSATRSCSPTIRSRPAPVPTTCSPASTRSPRQPGRGRTA